MLKLKKIKKILYRSIFELYVQIMNNLENKKEQNLKILQQISKDSRISQRRLAKDLGLSLGKMNYCLGELKKKGLVKIKNFKNNPNKLNYIYVLTPKGLSYRAFLTLNFMKKKIYEYDQLKSEYEKIKQKKM